MTRGERTVEQASTQIKTDKLDKIASSPSFTNYASPPPPPPPPPSIPDSGQRKNIFQVTEGHRSKRTAYEYGISFGYFLDYVRIHDLDVLLDLGRDALQQLVMKYAKSLRDNAEKKYSRSTVNGRISAVLYFFDNNDIELNKRMIRRYYPADESTHDDRPYTHEEIQRMLNSGIDLRTKLIILLMVSSGVRIGSLHTMQIGDLIPVTWNNHSLYKVQVYARTPDKYYTFCTQECYEAIQEYLNYRKRCGEELKDKSPLFRKHFNKHDPFTINVPKFLTERAIASLLDEALKKSGVKTSEARRSHGFRKGFMSICEQSGMKSINVKLLLDHNIGVSGHYYRPTESNILEDYMGHAADLLTIDPTKRLQKQIKDLNDKHSEEWNQLKQQMNELRSLLNQKI
jgi:integrase